MPDMRTGEQIQRDLLTWGGYAVGVIGALQAHGITLPHGSLVQALLTDPVFLSTAAIAAANLVVKVRRSRLRHVAHNIYEARLQQLEERFTNRDEPPSAMNRLFVEARRVEQPDPLAMPRGDRPGA